jgi:hypothetical protein
MTGSTTIEAIGCSTANKKEDNQVGVAISARRTIYRTFFLFFFF